MKIKRLDIFLLKAFLPIFVMTFGICLFIVLMNFLWKYVDEMVGKGLEMSVLVEVFIYAALNFVPMSLPIAILLASLMTFGNLGEQFELLAIKASGISLLRIMKPLTVFLCFVAVGSFYFQNHAIPYSQVKFWTLLYSMREKSPELDIPEGTFFNGIPDFNLYVRNKENNGLLKDVMIYDYAGGFANLRVTVADSGRLKMASDKLHLILTLYNGELFSNFDQSERRTSPTQPVPYRKESFGTKEILIKYDANFNRQSEAVWNDRHISKNLAQLRQSIDSMAIEIDSIREQNSKQIYSVSYKRLFSDLNKAKVTSKTADADTVVINHNIDEIFQKKNKIDKLSLLSQIKSSIEGVQIDYGFKSNILASEDRKMRQHYSEMHQKFSLSFACLIFFFIGAPLGAIIRKGGLGLPTVISVALFIFYHIMSNIGLKMTVSGIWQPWQGMWLSTAVLFPLGIYLTYKATNDSAILNIDTYIVRLKKIIGIRDIRKAEKKEVILVPIVYSSFYQHVSELKDDSIAYLSKNKRWIHYFSFWKHGGDDLQAIELSDKVENVYEEGLNSDKNIVLNKLMDFPIIDGYRFNLHLSEKTSKIIGYLFPISIFFYLFAVYRRKFLLRDVQLILQTCEELLETVIKL